MKFARRVLLTLLFFPWSLAYFGLGKGGQIPKASVTDTWEMDPPALPHQIPEETAPSPSPLVGTPYKVQKGDTVEKLAVIFLTTEESIRRMNGLAPEEGVFLGQVIQIPPVIDP